MLVKYAQLQAHTGQICTLQVCIRARKAGQMQSRHLSNTRSRNWSNTKSRHCSSTEPPQYKTKPSLVKKRSRHACLTTSRLRAQGRRRPLWPPQKGALLVEKGASLVKKGASLVKTGASLVKKRADGSRVASRSDTAPRREALVKRWSKGIGQTLVKRHWSNAVAGRRRLLLYNRKLRQGACWRHGSREAVARLFPAATVHAAPRPHN